MAKAVAAAVGMEPERAPCLRGWLDETHRTRNTSKSGEDQFVFLWLTAVAYHREEQRFSGLFFELPRELTKWHKVGERLAFDAEDIFDWMILDQGTLHGGFTLRVARQQLPEAERADYDRRVGATSWHPLPE